MFPVGDKERVINSSGYHFTSKLESFDFLSSDYLLLLCSANVLHLSGNRNIATDEKEKTEKQENK